MTEQQRRWLITAICADCLHSPTGRAILNGTVAIATIREPEQPERCILCGWPLATD